MAIALFQNINDDLSGESSANFILGICLFKGSFNGTNAQISIIVVTCTKADSQQDRLLAFHCGTGVVNDHLLNALVLAQTVQNTLDLITGVGENSLPRVFLVTSHIVIGVITSHDHQRQQDNLVIVTGINFSEHFVYQRSALNSADKVVGKTSSMQTLLNSGVALVGFVVCTMTHKDNSGAINIVGCSFFLQDFNHGVIVFVGSQQRSTDQHAVKLVSITGDLLHHIIILKTGDDMGGLNNDILNTIGDQTFHSLFHIVDFHLLALFENVNDDLRSKSSTNFIIRVSALESRLSGINGCLSSLVVAAAKANSQNNRLLLSSIICRGVVFASPRATGSQPQNKAQCHQKRNDLLREFHFGFLHFD